MGHEYDDVELPFLNQCRAMGWQVQEGSKDDPSLTGRSTFRDTIAEATLRERLHAINPGPDGQPWLDDARLSEAVSALTRHGHRGLMEANQAVTELLLRGLTVEGLPGWDGGRGQTIRYIDWDDVGANTFTIANQFRVDCPPGHDVGKGFIIPDLVLLVNGIPVLVVEAKSPAIPEPLAEAVKQLRRYHNARKAALEVEENEGAPALFASVQLLIATSFDQARVGCVGAGLEHYGQWKTVVGPDGTGSEDEVAADLGKKGLSEQERLVAGMLRPAHLLDILRHYLLFMNVGGQTIKTVCRYQQYRAVNRALERLRTGKTRAQDGEYDRRGGIVWHTQGSGKSLTMVFMIRKMRTDSALRKFKVIMVTDRRDLQRQLSETATLSGDVVELATNAVSLKHLARRKGPGLVFATIQKYRTDEDVAEVTKGPAFEVLNEDETILVVVDEAHRTQAGDLHANLMAALPNCARIGFTGTPIIMGEKKRTAQIFGDFIDRYTIKEAEADGATVPVLYEGRTAEGALKDGATLDGLFEDMFRNHTEEELEAIRKKYATKGNILEAPALIADKARYMLRHYVTNLMPNGYKAQVVAYSRTAVIRYHAAFLKARDELLEQANALPDQDKAIDDEALCTKSPLTQALVQAWRYRDTLARIEFAPVMSGSNNDDPTWRQWTDGSAQETRIKRFKKPLFHKDPAKTDPLAFLIVKSMLLTGFDAPIEGVMYLDRSIREAELLQAIARVNRTGFGKSCGIVVDYFGVAHHLKAALAAYAEEDIEGALVGLKDQIPVLRDRHIRVVDIFRRAGLENLSDDEGCLNVLAREKARAEFTVKLKDFLTSLEIILPRPEGLPFVKDAKRLAYIHARARNRYRDVMALGSDVGAKVRKLIDDHVISLGINPKIPPVQLTDAEFDTHVGRTNGNRAKASEMEHAIRSHIRKHLETDPVLFKKMSERLKQILDGLGQQWDQIVKQLQALIDELRSDSQPVESAASDIPEVYLPFLRTVLEACSTGENMDTRQLQVIHQMTRDAVDRVVEEVCTNRSIWSSFKLADQESLRSEVFEIIFDTRLEGFSIAEAERLADQLMQQAKANEDKLRRA
ncbi:type I restriction endonuclease subunit R [Paracoccus sediminis]|uniref:Type I restriction enzyme endonuclease subunit n=1 Tax=Paracoccus sediminis TaxID=1214787 RepID=A0A238Y8R5_9RHOB|nr:HsdR family type I site-specific deoxyribonuclease [Paracoccus sediminis]TBN46995.1 type I restriction endonuclease subunit R [Paracoccus sediminis]SNR67615.1 type I restriction enzyme, R subunit [Paracoccus sediminis]